MIDPVPRCPKCHGVDSKHSMKATMSVGTLQIMLRELERLGVPAELLQPLKTWGDETFRRCVCSSQRLFG